MLDRFAKVRLRFFLLCLNMVCGFLILSAIGPTSALAATGIRETVNFQGKVVNSDGTNVPNGSYDFVFGIYSVASSGSPIWTETWNSGTSQVTVVDGVFRVELGTHTSLPGSVDFNTDNLWLGVNFNSDGEMDPRIRFTAVPYAFNAKRVAGLTVTDTTGTLTIPNATIAFSGNNNLTFTTTGTTSLTLPTSGALVSTNWEADTDAEGYDLKDLSNLEFRSTTGAPAGTTVAAYSDNSGDLNLNVLSSKALNVQVAGTDEYTFTSTAFNAGSKSILGAAIDQSSAAILAVGNTTATGLSLCNSATCDAITIGTNTDADTISIGDSNDGLTIASTTFNVSSGAVSGITTLSSSGDWTWTATTPTITINGSETFSVTNGTDTFAVNTSGSALSFSDGSNSFTFDADTGPLYAGNARPARQITLSPEYPGATLSGDGSNNSGTMTSDFCEQGASADVPNTNTTVCNTSGDIHNYYSWTTGQGSAQDYDIWIRYRIPDNFAAWNSNPIQVYGKRTDATNNAVTVYVYDTAGTLENAGGTQVAGTTWTQTAVEASFAGTYTAGSYMTIRIVMNADTGGDSVQVGEINLNYRSNN